MPTDIMKVITAMRRRYLWQAFIRSIHFSIL